MKIKKFIRVLITRDWPETGLECLIMMAGMVIMSVTGAFILTLLVAYLAS